MPGESWSVRRRTFIAMVGASSAALAGCSSLDPWHSKRPLSPAGLTVNLDQVYRIARRYYLGPKRKRPQASDAEGTIWEVTDPTWNGPTRRTFSDGTRWLTLSVEPDSLEASRTGEYYLTPSEGFEKIQQVIDRTGGDVVIHLAPGTYVGSELTLDHGVILEGAGRNATTLKLEPGANTDLITTPNPPKENVMECTFRNLTFHGNRANNSTGNVVYGAFWNGRFVDCTFQSAPESGFWLAGSEASTDDNLFRGCQFILNNGVGLRGGENKESYPSVGVVRVAINWFGTNDGPAITAHGDSWKITGSKFYDNALNWGGTIELDRCTYSSVAGCDIYSGLSNRDLIFVTASTGTNSVGNQIVNNDLRGGYRSGIRCLADGSDVVALQVRGNTVQSDGSATSGIVARARGLGSYRNCSFRDNTFVGRVTGSKNALPSDWVTSGNLSS